MLAIKGMTSDRHASLRIIRESWVSTEGATSGITRAMIMKLCQAVVAVVLAACIAARPQQPTFDLAGQTNNSSLLGGGATCLSLQGRLRSGQPPDSASEASDLEALPRPMRTKMSGFKPFPPNAALYPQVRRYPAQVILTFIGEIIADYDSKYVHLWNPLPNNFYAFDKREWNLRFWMSPVGMSSRPMCWYDVDKVVGAYVDWICEAGRGDLRPTWPETFYEYQVGDYEEVLVLGGLARQSLMDELGSVNSTNTPSQTSQVTELTRK